MALRAQQPVVDASLVEVVGAWQPAYPVADAKGLQAQHAARIVAIALGSSSASRPTRARASIGGPALPYAGGERPQRSDRFLLAGGTADEGIAALRSEGGPRRQERARWQRRRRRLERRQR